VQGQRNDLVDNINDVATSPDGTSREAALRKLRKDRPDLHTRVLNEELTPHARACAVACCAGSCGQKETHLTRHMDKARFVPCAPFGEVGLGHKLPGLHAIVGIASVLPGGVRDVQA
jgi:hypothetical protein